MKYNSHFRDKPKLFQYGFEFGKPRIKFSTLWTETIEFIDDNGIPYGLVLHKIEPRENGYGYLMKFTRLRLFNWIDELFKSESDCLMEMHGVDTIVYFNNLDTMLECAEFIKERMCER